MTGVGGAVDLVDLEDVVGRWVAGWAVVRRMAPPERDGAAWVVDPLSPVRSRELVLAEPTPTDLEHAVGRVRGSRDVWLTTFTASRPSHPVPQGMVGVRQDEVLMRRTLTDTQPRGAATVEPDGDRACATVWVDDVVAARGWVGVTGGHAVVDRVETHEDFRRRGLGSDVMRALEEWAVTAGAATGLLAATTSGQALYTRLGWEVLARMTTVSGA